MKSSDKTEPVVSIVTPSFNQAEFIEDTILSVFNQDYPNIEYLIVDGGSTDGTISIIKRYEERVSKWISEPDRGQSDAINKGWRMASGEILAWLNSDDLYTPGAVRAAAQAFIENPGVGMVYGDAIVIDRDGNELVKSTSRKVRSRRFTRWGSPIPSRLPLPQPSIFFRADVLRQVGYLDINLHYAMDFDLIQRVARASSILYLPRTLSSMRWYLGTKTTSNVHHNLREKVDVIKRYDRFWFLSGYWFVYLRYLVWMRTPSWFKNYFRKKRGLARDQVFLQTVDS